MRAFLAVVAAGMLCTPGAARGDPDELERRLRTADVPAAVRRDVRAAVDRAVGFLASRQAADGSFAEGGKADGAIPVLTLTLRAAVTLRHAGTPAAFAACDRAAAWLFDAPLDAKPRPVPVAAPK